MTNVYEEEKFNREHQNDAIKATDIVELKMTNNPNGEISISTDMSANRSFTNG